MLFLFIYMCIYTCSTSGTYERLKRFIIFASIPTIYGMPWKMQSDNAKTFKGSSVSVKKIMQTTEVKNHLANKQVNWDFIVEKAPWWGGYWERSKR